MSDKTNVIQPSAPQSESPPVNHAPRKTDCREAERREAVQKLIGKLKAA
jgi:hypothetical protein